MARSSRSRWGLLLTIIIIFQMLSSAWEAKNNFKILSSAWEAENY